MSGDAAVSGAQSSTVGLIGAGNMATAMARGFVASGLVSPQSIIASARTNATLDKFRAEVGDAVTTTQDNSMVAAQSGTVFLCVKPQYILSVLREIRDRLAGLPVVLISVAAGVTLGQMAGAAGVAAKIIRLMPNTACRVGQGVASYCCSNSVTAEEEARVVKLFNAVGKCFKVPDESLMDSTAGLAGCGTAFVMSMIQAMSDGGVKVGIPRAMATEMAAHTLRGAATMVLETGTHPIQLRDEVMSPGGATVYGVHVLESGRGFCDAVIGAIEASTQRGRDLRDMVGE